MHTLIRTILICLAAFTAGQILPPDATLLGLLVAGFASLSIVDFGLYIWSGRGLLNHITNSEQ